MKYLIKQLIFVLLLISFTTFTAQAAVESISIMVAPKSIQFHIEDFNGNISGYTPNGILDNIGAMGAYMESGVVDTPPSELTEYDEWHVIQPKTHFMPPGKYKIVLYGINEVKFPEVSIELWGETTSNSGNYASYKRTHVLFPNMIQAYEFEIPANLPNSKDTIIQLTKVSTPQDLIADIQLMAKEEDIGNQEFVNELIKEIQKIEKERLKPADKDEKLTPAQKAKKEYQELLEEITEKYKKPEKDEFIGEVSYSILKDDITYIINHIQ